MDFTLNFCEYNRSNSDYDRIFRPEGSGDFLFLLFKTPMKVYLGGQLTVTRDNACIFYIPEIPSIIRLYENFGTVMSIFPAEKTWQNGSDFPATKFFTPVTARRSITVSRSCSMNIWTEKFFPRTTSMPCSASWWSQPHGNSAVQIQASLQTRSSADCSKKSVWKCLQITKSHGQQKSSAPWLISKKVSFIPVTGIFLTAPLMLTWICSVWKKPKICSPTKLCLFNRWLCCADFQISPTSAGTSERTVAVRPVSGHAAPDQKDIHTLHSLRRQLVWSDHRAALHFS